MLRLKAQKTALKKGPTMVPYTALDDGSRNYSERGPYHSTLYYA